MGIFLDKDEGLYAFPDGSTGWEGEQRNSAITHSWSNRNALHVDTTGNISKHKTIIQKIIDGYKGVLDEDVFQKSFQTPEEIQTAISKFLKNSGLSHTLRPENLDVLVYNLKQVLPQIDATTHFEMYSEAGIKVKNDFHPYIDIGNGIYVFNFVKLNDKELYIKDFAENILKAIRFSANFITYHEQFLHLYIKLGYISEEQIKNRISEVLINKGLEIYTNLVNNKIYSQYIDHIPEYQKYILAFCFINGTITKEMASELNFDHGENFDYYILNYGKVSLIHMYYKKILNELSIEDEKRYFGV